jgi:anti-sigma factor RsiW
VALLRSQVPPDWRPPEFLTHFHHTVTRESTMPSAPQPNHGPRISRETLHALVVDDACGQLSADAAELLHAWLACHPEDAREAEGIRAAVSLAGQACRAAAPPAVDSNPTPVRRRTRRPPAAAVAGALAASIAVVVAMAWRPRPVEPEPAARPPIQWTRYVLAADQSGRYTFKPVRPGGTP